MKRARSESGPCGHTSQGQGRYWREHWTLVLEYNDGRVNHVSFVATNREQPTEGVILNGYPIEANPN